MKSKNLTDRVFLIDEVRGFAILCMVLYHAVFDLIILFQISFPFFFSGFMNTTRDVFAGLFIFISGAACRFSSNNLKRGAVCFGLGLLMTLATFLVVPGELIVFGILHMLGISMMLFSLLSPLLDKCRPVIAVPILAVLFLLTYQITSGTLSILGLFSVSLPDELYRTSFLFPFGFPSPEFRSADYFPLLPWLFVFLAGSFFGTRLKQRRCPAFFYRMHCRPLAILGRYTLYLYLLHQPIIYGIMSAILYITQQ